MTAGYSGTPLARKLGITPGTTVALADPPATYADLVAPLPDGARLTTTLPDVPTFVHIFVTRRDALQESLKRLRASMDDDAVIWVSWPKRASRVATDVTEDAIRDVALPLGLVDIKVCAIDPTWSGLKLVLRKELRASTPTGRPTRPAKHSPRP